MSLSANSNIKLNEENISTQISVPKTNFAKFYLMITFEVKVVVATTLSIPI